MRSLKIGATVAFLSVCFITYYLLLHENGFPISIPSIINFSNHLTLKQRLLVLGLLPIYIGVMIFGAGILGIYVASKLTALRSVQLKNSTRNKR